MASLEIQHKIHLRYPIYNIREALSHGEVMGRSGVVILIEVKLPKSGEKVLTQAAGRLLMLI